MARNDLPSLIVRAKKMAGALGRVPSEGELIQSFHSKGTEINVETAREIMEAVRQHRKAQEESGSAPKGRGGKKSPPPEPVGAGAPASPRGRGYEVQAPKPPPKPEVAPNIPSPPVKRTTSYLRR